MFGCHHEYSWLGLSLAIRACTDEVIKIVENRADTTPKKRRHRSRSADNNEPFGPQLLLFPVDREARHKLVEMFDAVSICLMKNNHSGRSLPKAKYYGYEMFDFIRRWKDEEWEPQLAKMKQIADGEIPTDEECLNLISFLDRVESNALANWQQRSSRGGCFA